MTKRREHATFSSGMQFASYNPFSFPFSLSLLNGRRICSIKSAVLIRYYVWSAKKSVLRQSRILRAGLSVVVAALASDLMDGFRYDSSVHFSLERQISNQFLSIDYREHSTPLIEGRFGLFISFRIVGFWWKWLRRQMRAARYAIGIVSRIPGFRCSKGLSYANSQDSTRQDLDWNDCKFLQIFTYFFLFKS